LKLNEFLKNVKGKVVIAGIGNPLRGDDAVGSYIVKELNNKLRAILIDCEDQPERFIEKIVENKPETVIFIDAVHMNQKPGSVVFMRETDLEEYTGISSHQTNLKHCIDYIKAKITCKIFIVAIQPENTEFGRSMSKKILEVAETLRHLFIQTLNKN